MQSINIQTVRDYNMCSFANIKAIREWTTKPHRFSEADRYVLAPYFESDEFYEQGWDL